MTGAPSEPHQSVSDEDLTYRRGRERLTQVLIEEFRGQGELFDRALRDAIVAADLRAKTANDALEQLINAKHGGLADLCQARFESYQESVVETKALALTVEKKAQVANDNLERLISANQQALSTLIEVQMTALKASIAKAEETSHHARTLLDSRFETALIAMEKQLSERVRDVSDRLTIRSESVERATTIASNQMDRRLEGMNEFRDALREQATTFMSRNEITSMMVNFTDGVKKIEERIAITMSRPEIISAINPVADNLRKVEEKLSTTITRADMQAQIDPISQLVRRLENRGSNLDGRFWALSITAGAVGICINLMITLGVIGLHAPPTATPVYQTTPPPGAPAYLAAPSVGYPPAPLTPTPSR
jgi:hypothetical protein